LLEFPDIAPRYAGASGRYRVKRYRSHHAYYRREGDDALIVRIIHVRQDAGAALR
jgi:plasmid stabilization system protein ParE